jgi:hypothetical protein
MQGKISTAAKKTGIHPKKVRKAATLPILRALHQATTLQVDVYFYSDKKV